MFRKYGRFSIIDIKTMLLLKQPYLPFKRLCTILICGFIFLMALFQLISDYHDLMSLRRQQIQASCAYPV